MAIPDATAEPVARRSGRLLVACLVEVWWWPRLVEASWFFRLDNSSSEQSPDRAKPPTKTWHLDKGLVAVVQRLTLCYDDNLSGLRLFAGRRVVEARQVAIAQATL